MNFQEQLNQIQNYTKEDCLQNHEFMLDCEHLHLEDCINTGYRHERLTDYTDNELRILYDAMCDKVMELF